MFHTHPLAIEFVDETQGKYDVGDEGVPTADDEEHRPRARPAPNIFHLALEGQNEVIINESCRLSIRGELERRGPGYILTLAY
jgi:hypothetical protein